jgi:4-carboxymuconolactone decarboxylase
MSSEQFDKGLKIRKEVMGDDYVERALDIATDFTMPLQ